jgi:hypothetical protein
VLVNLKAALAARRMRQVDLAIELKISPSVLSEIVNGRRSAEPFVARSLGRNPTGRRGLAVCPRHSDSRAEIGHGANAGDRLRRGVRER